MGTHAAKIAINSDDCNRSMAMKTKMHIQKRPPIFSLRRSARNCNSEFNNSAACRNKNETVIILHSFASGSIEWTTSSPLSHQCSQCRGDSRSDVWSDGHRVEMSAGDGHCVSIDTCSQHAQHWLCNLDEVFFRQSVGRDGVSPEVESVDRWDDAGLLPAAVLLSQQRWMPLYRKAKERMAESRDYTCFIIVNCVGSVWCPGFQ